MFFTRVGQLLAKCGHDFGKLSKNSNSKSSWRLQPRNINYQTQRSLTSSSQLRKKFSDEDDDKPPEVGQYKNPWYILRDEFRSTIEERLPIPRETDIAIIGGGAIGSSVAYWLKQRSPDSFNVHVIERDPTYTRAATVLSVGGLRQQFSLPENIEMSLFTAEFIRNIRHNLSIYDKDPPDIQFNPQGYLFMATEDGVPILEKNSKLQTDLGAKLDILTSSQLKEKYPWMNTEDLALASHGVQNEGWFDPWLLLGALRNKATSLGANYVKGEVVGFREREGKIQGYDGIIRKKKHIDTLEIKHEDGKIYPMKFAVVINCAGPWAGEVGRMAGIGTGEGAMRFPIPVEPRKRYVFVVHCPDGPGLDTPMVIDPSGMYFRREGLGGYYICGISPTKDEEPNTNNLDVDYDYFNEKVWPLLAQRVPAFECLKLKSAWAGYYDYNYFDQNLIIGNHPYHRNFIMATGCSGHGIQQSPAIGRAVMEMIIDQEFKTIDLSRFSFDRVLDDEPVFEECIV